MKGFLAAIAAIVAAMMAFKPSVNSYTNYREPSFKFKAPKGKLW